MLLVVLSSDGDCGKVDGGVFARAADIADIAERSEYLLSCAEMLDFLFECGTFRH